MISLEYVHACAKHSSNPYEIRIDCPECGDTKGHMYCNIHKMVYHCHKCGASGRILAKNETNLEHWWKVSGLIDVYRKGFDKFGKDWDKAVDKFVAPIKPVGTQVRNLPHSELCTFTSLTDIDSHPAAIYLKKRGVTYEELREYSIRISREKYGPYRECIVFPIYNEYDSSQLDYFVCRRYTDMKPKYVNAPWPKMGTVFKKINNPTKPIVIVEGILDAIAIARTGHNAMALLGKQITSQQLLYIRRFGAYRYLIYLDHDALMHAVNLKLQFGSLDLKSRIVLNNSDAAAQYVYNRQFLRELLDEYTRQLEKL